MRNTKIILIVSAILLCSLPYARTQTNGEGNPFSVYLENYGRDVGLAPYGFNIRNFLAYPYLIARASRNCQLRLHEYNYYLLQNNQDTTNGVPQDAETINALDEVSNFVYLSSLNENDFTGYEECRDDFAQRYYVLHRDDQPYINHFGMCVPDDCTPDDVLSIVNGLRDLRQNFGEANVNQFAISQAVLDVLDEDFDLRVYDSDVQNEDAKDVEAGHVFFWTFFGILGLLVLMGTGYHIYIQIRDGEDIAGNPGVQAQRNLTERLIFGFSILKSLEKLTDTTSKMGANTLECMRGFKFIFTIWLAAGFYSYVMYIPLKESEKLEDELTKDVLTVLGKSLIFLTDCLLWISGVYTTYGFIYQQVILRDEESQTPRDKMVYCAIEIAIKVSKLFFLSAMALLVFGWAGPTIGNGPVFSEQYYYNTRKVNDYWYTYLTFSNNFLEIQNQGLLWGSFIATEMQLFICALPFISMLIKRRTLALGIISLLMVGSLASSFVWSITKDVKISVIRDAYQVVEYQQKFFLKAFPYGMGILTGLFTWKAHHEDNEEGIFKRIVDKIEESGPIRYIMHLSGITMILLVIIALHPIDHDRDHNIDAVSAVLLTASQVLMPVGLALNFIPMVLNRSETLKSIMGSHILKPHSSLLFIMIPVSGTLIMWSMYCLQDGLYFDFKTYVVYACAFWLVCAFISLLLWLFIISPIYNTLDTTYDFLKFQYQFGEAKGDYSEPQKRLKDIGSESSEDDANEEDDYEEPSKSPIRRNFVPVSDE